MGRRGASVLGIGLLALLLLAPVYTYTRKEANETITGNWTFSGGLSTPWLTKSISITNPTASENDGIFYSPVALTITEVRCVITGTTSATYNVTYGASRASGTNVTTSPVACSNTTTGTTATLNNTAVAAGSYVWLITTALSGTPTELHIDVKYTIP